MSVRVTSAILDVNTGSPGTKLILVILADFAREDGSSIYPSIATICERSCMCERAVRENLGRLKDAGFIEVQKRRHGLPTVYRIPFHTPAESAKLPKIGPVPDTRVPRQNLPKPLAENAPNPLELKKEEFFELEEEEVVFPWDSSPTGWIPNSVVKDVADGGDPK